LLFEGSSLLSGLGDGLVAMRFQQLPGVVVDFDFLHSHGVMLLCSATEHASRTRATGIDTFQDLQGAA
jgi:hypothetical protein